MRLFSVMLSSVLLLGDNPALAKPPETAARALPTNASPLKVGSQRHTRIVEIQAGKVDACRKLFAAFPEELAELYRAARHRNMTTFLKELGGKSYLITNFEYAGIDYAGDVARLEKKEAMKNWRKALAEVLASPQPALGGENIEEVFYTGGAADVVPTPEKYARIGMVTGLKPEMEAEYRTLHATPWPGVLKGIKDSHYRNFTIRLVELDGGLYLIGYLEYVGKDAAADAAAAQALPVNKRWWKFTDACQKPPAAAAAKGEMWDGLEEIHHLD
jgi:L-rhamnose mutarotase